MATSKTPTKAPTKTPTKKFDGLTQDERDALKERTKELKGKGGADTEADVLAKIDGMNEFDRAIGARLHQVIKAAAPGLTAKLWYGMPAYYRDGKMICFFQSAAKFKARYATLGFSDQANLDNGALWPASYAVAELTPEVEAAVEKLIARAVS